MRLRNIDIWNNGNTMIPWLVMYTIDIALNCFIVDFRHLVCFECTIGTLYPVSNYGMHVKHMKTGCQACYNEWDFGWWWHV